MQELNMAVEAVVAANPLVGIWLKWMMFIAFASILFIWKRVPARYVLGSMFLIFPIGLLIFKLTGNVNLIGLAHILVWGPLAAYLCKVIRSKSFNFKSFYGVWLVLFEITIIISLLFDVRDVFLVMTGVK